MNKWFIFWGDYEGNYVEEFENIGDAEKKLAQILAKQEEKKYGTGIYAVIYGTERKYKVFERVAAVKIEE